MSVVCVFVPQRPLPTSRPTKAFSVELRHKYKISKSTLLPPRGSHWSENTLQLLLADIINSSCCDWLVWVLTLTCAGFDSSSKRCGLQEDKRHSGTWKRYPLALGATALCSAVYHLTLHNWVHTSTKWRSLWRPTDREGRVYQRERRRMFLVTCTVLPPCFFFCLCGEKRTN